MAPENQKTKLAWFDWLPDCAAVELGVVKCIVAP